MSDRFLNFCKNVLAFIGLMAFCAALGAGAAFGFFIGKKATEAVKPVDCGSRYCKDKGENK